MTPSLIPFWKRTTPSLEKYGDHLSFCRSFLDLYEVFLPAFATLKKNAFPTDVRSLTTAIR